MPFPKGWGVGVKAEIFPMAGGPVPEGGGIQRGLKKNRSKSNRFKKLKPRRTLPRFGGRKHTNPLSKTGEGFQKVNQKGPRFHRDPDEIGGRCRIPEKTLQKARKDF